MADEAVPGRRELAALMAEAAQAWLDTLTPEQRSVAVGAGPGDGPDDAERRRWFYTPTDHGGLTVHEQRPTQQRAAMRLVASGLSMAGYVTVATVMGLENVLDRVEGFVTIFDRERGRDPGLYYLRVFGDPATGTWGWRYGGHHVSLNNLVVDGELVATTPCFLGADPATSPLLGGALNRPLGRVEDLGRDLVRSLSPELAARAVLLDKAPSDFVTANRTTVSPGDRVIPLAGIWRDERFPDDEQQAKLQALSDAIDDAADFSEAGHAAVELTEDPQGVAGRDLDDGQREVLWALLGTYFDRVPEGVSPARAYDGPALDDVHVAWAGPTEPGAPHYYRLQGPGLLIEWDNTQRGANHAHSVWRDPSRDFGADLLAAHHARHH
ncbi:DUF3500 domain-containing protein [Arthrobacter sp. NEB 688]|uniref:DUF3500 domain-containing protein n=1 Tax=Arthrobacter sp. NEB 688 TaxID=904039 RepID=UPI001564C4EE|nr:DUF3500 domain-containing protein [Arthrobacter sp. NEB 688]QKE84412.1 DUF3500 domain-containing protein [Arthrobacter sp. NEB 688]